MNETCSICGNFAGFETSPEGECCRVCGEWVCEACVDWKRTDMDPICKPCSEVEVSSIKTANDYLVELENIKWMTPEGKETEWGNDTPIGLTYAVIGVATEAEAVETAVRWANAVDGDFYAVDLRGTNVRIRKL